MLMHAVKKMRILFTSYITNDRTYGFFWIDHNCNLTFQTSGICKHLKNMIKEFASLLKISLNR